jgi:FkbM family methyltransferase
LARLTPCLYADRLVYGVPCFYGLKKNAIAHFNRGHPENVVSNFHVYTSGAGMRHKNLIFDIGVNEGQDSDFYLEKGFRVVGAEANPVLLDRLRVKFRRQIADETYILVNGAIWSEAGTLPFYVNLDNCHWSSLDKSYGTRNSTKYEVIDVPCVTIASLLAKHGVPHYMKIDIEGADKTVLKDLCRESTLPEFISVEEYGVKTIDDLRRLGYSGFKIVPQGDKRCIVPPNPPSEGYYAYREFTGNDSGLFGRELSGDWMRYRRAKQMFIETVRNEDHTYVGKPREWYDIHARLSVLVKMRRVFGG